MTLAGRAERTEFFLASRHILDFAWNAGTELCKCLILLGKTCSSFCSKGDLFQFELRFCAGTRYLANTLSMPCSTSSIDELLYNEISVVRAWRCASHQQRIV
jgi:hypothetical protein